MRTGEGRFKVGEDGDVLFLVLRQPDFFWEVASLLASGPGKALVGERAFQCHSPCFLQLLGRRGCGCLCVQVAGRRSLCGKVQGGLKYAYPMNVRRQDSYGLPTGTYRYLSISCSCLFTISRNTGWMSEW